MRRLVLIAAMVGFGGCAHHPPRLDPHCTEIARAPSSDELQSIGVLRDKTVSKVAVTGADPSLAATLERVLATKPGAALGSDVVRDDLRRLWALGVLSDVRVDVRSDHGGAAVTFAVTPQPLIDRVYLTEPGLLELRRFLWLEGTPYEPVRVARMADAARTTLVSEGYLDANVAVHRASGPGVGVCVVSSRGPHVTIDRLVFPGRSAVTWSAVANVMRGAKAGINHPGGIYDASLIDEDRLAIMNLYYEIGRLDTHIDDPVVTRHRDHLSVSIPIRESPVFTIGKVRVLAIHGERVQLGLHRGEVLVRSRMWAASDVLRGVYGVDMNIFPTTNLDVEHHVIDLDFHVEWSWPWHALHFLPSR